MTDVTKKLNLFLGLIVFVVSLYLYLPFARIGVDLHHDGLMLKSAMDVAHGQILHKETFSQYGSLTTYVHAFGLSLFGERLYILRLITVFSLALSSMFLVWSWSMLMPVWLAFLGITVWWSQAYFYRPDFMMFPWASDLALLCQSLTLFLILYFIKEKPRPIIPFFAGCVAGISFWFRMPVGITLFAALMLVPLSTKQLKIIYAKKVALGFVIAQLPLLFLLIKNDSFLDWKYQVIQQPREIMGYLMNPFLLKLRDALLPDRSKAWVSLLAVGLLTLGSSFGSVFLSQRSKKEFKAKMLGFVLMMGALALLLWQQWGLDAGFRFDPWHASIPVLLVCGWLYWALISYTKKNISTESQMWMAALVIALSAWHQYFPVTCQRHMFWGVSMAIGPFFGLLYMATEKRAWRVSLLFLIGFAPVLLDQGKMALRNLDRPLVELTRDNPYRGMFVTQEVFDYIAPIEEVISSVVKEFPNVPMVVNSVDAGYLPFVKNLQNPGPLFIWWFFSEPNMQNLRLKFYHEKRPIVLFERWPAEASSGLSKNENYTAAFIKDAIAILVPTEMIKSLKPITSFSF